MQAKGLQQVEAASGNNINKTSFQLQQTPYNEVLIFPVYTGG